MTDKSVPIPAEGGSYVVTPKGKLEQRAKTIGPLDPEHETNKPKPPAPSPSIRES